MIQIYSSIWTYRIVVKEQAFIFKTSGASHLITESALSLFLLIGLTFYIGGGADHFDDKARVGLQWVAIISIGLSCLLSIIDLSVGIYRSVLTYFVNRKINKFREEKRVMKEE